MAKNLKFSRYLRKSKYTYSNQKLYSAKITIAAYILKIRITIKSQKEVPNAIIMVTKKWYKEKERDW